MIEVSVTLISARRNGERTELARLEICNDETGTDERRNYLGRILLGRSKEQLDRRVVHRSAAVKNWPSKQRHVWNLVEVMLRNLGYGGARS